MMCGTAFMDLSALLVSASALRFPSDFSSSNVTLGKENEVKKKMYLEWFNLDNLGR